MPPRQNLFAVLALAVLLLIAFPLLVSIFGELPSAPSGSGAPPVIAGLPTPSASPTASATLTASLTASATPTLTTTPSDTPTPSPTPTVTPSVTPSSTPTPTNTATATPLPRVYLLPFVQVFAVGLAQPVGSTQVLMYDGGSDVFEVLSVQRDLMRMRTISGGMSFWTASGNISLTQPEPAQYDYSVKGRAARLTGSPFLACTYNDHPTLAFGACQQLGTVSSAVLNARVIAGTTQLYIAQINGVLEVISASALALVE